MRELQVALEDEIRRENGLERRAVLGGMLFTVAASSARASRGPQDQVEQAMNALTTALQDAHGGEWGAYVDISSGVVVVSRELAS